MIGLTTCLGSSIPRTTERTLKPKYVLMIGKVDIIISMKPNSSFWGKRCEKNNIFCSRQFSKKDDTESVKSSKALKKRKKKETSSESSSESSESDSSEVSF